MKEFFNRIHIPKTNIQFGTKNQVLCTHEDIDVESFLSENRNENLYFLAGVNKAIGRSRASNKDVPHRKYIVLDYDLRNEYKEGGVEISDREIVSEGRSITEHFENHELLKDWSYLIFTGNGVHIYYIGDPVLCDEDYKVGVDWFYSLAETVVPYRVDRTCKNSARILRMPNSYNNKAEPKKVEIIEKRNENAKILKIVREKGAEQLAIAKHEAMKKEIRFTVSADSNVYDAIQKVPIGMIVGRHFGWEFDGRNFKDAGGYKPKACFVPDGENYIVHGGTDHFSDSQTGYSPFEFVKMINNFSNKEVFEWFKKNYQEIADVDEKEREQWKKQNKDKKVDVPILATTTSVNSYTWGLDCIDEKITTLKKGRFAVLVSDENQGKSTYCFFVARKNFEKYGHRVLYFNLEQTKEEVATDMALQYVGATKIGMRDNIYDNDPTFLARKKQLLEQEDVVFIGRKATELTTMKTIKETLSEIDKMDFLILDNLTCIATQSVNKNEEIKQITLELINLATNLNIPILLVHHYRKMQTKKNEIFRDLHDMEGSGAIKNLTHTVIQVARNPSPTNDIELSEFYIREGKLRGGAKKESICVLHEKGDFVPHTNTAFNS